MALVHNVPMRLTTRLTALGLAASMALAACSGDDSETPEPQSQQEAPSASESSPPYLDVPADVELTAQGTELEVGEPATVAYEPRQGMIGALDIKVTSLERAGFSLFEGFELTKKTRKTAPYFVRARVTNVGETNLGERPVPLYMVDGENRLIEASVFGGEFKPCDGSTFPKRFRNGDSVKVCLVYLAPDKGDLTAVSFRPSQDFNPVTWTGEVGKAGAKETKKAKNKQKGNNNDSGG